MVDGALALALARTLHLALWLPSTTRYAAVWPCPWVVVCFLLLLVMPWCSSFPFLFLLPRSSFAAPAPPFLSPLGSQPLTGYSGGYTATKPVPCRGIGIGDEEVGPSGCDAPLDSASASPQLRGLFAGGTKKLSTPMLMTSSINLGSMSSRNLHGLRSLLGDETHQEQAPSCFQKDHDVPIACKPHIHTLPHQRP